MTTSSNKAKPLETVQTIVVIATCVVLVILGLRTRAERPSDTPLPTGLLSTDGALTAGSQTAASGMIVFTDYQCPFCRKFAAETWPLIKEKYVDTGKLLVVFRMSPIERIHPEARLAAVASHCANESGKFTEMDALLFANPKNLKKPDLLLLGEKIGIPSQQLDDCLAQRHQAAISADQKLATDLKMEATPSFFVGQRVDGGLRVSARLRGAKAFAGFDKAITESLDTSYTTRVRRFFGGLY